MRRHGRADPDHRLHTTAPPPGWPAPKAWIWATVVVAAGGFLVPSEALGGAAHRAAADALPFEASGGAHPSPDVTGCVNLAGLAPATDRCAELRARPLAADTPVRGSHIEVPEIPLRATLRAAERARRAAGRPGFSARRDPGSLSAVVTTADAALAPARGAAPEQAGSGPRAPQSGLHACGVRGPPADARRCG